MKLGDAPKKYEVSVDPDGCLELDVAPWDRRCAARRIVEVYGPESSGKTTVALHMIAEAQNRAARQRLSTPSTRFDPVYAKNLGVDIDNLYVSQPSTGEEALEITECSRAAGDRYCGRRLCRGTGAKI